MNNKLKVSLLITALASLFMSGCGPQDINAADYVAQMADQDNINANEGGCPTGNCPMAQKGAPGGGGCPTGDCEIAPDPDTSKTVRMPDLRRTEPTKVVNTEERQVATDTVVYQQTEHVDYPNLREHEVTKHRHGVNIYEKTIVNHPSFRRQNSVKYTSSSENQSMPVKVINAEPIDYGCAAAQPAPEPVVEQPVVQTVLRPVYFVRPFLF